MKRAQSCGQIQVSSRVPALVETRRDLDHLDLPVSEHRRMPMKRESRQHVQLLLVRKSPIRPERPAAGGKFIEEELAVTEFHPFLDAKGRSYRF
jgi:hypothetical protein